MKLGSNVLSRARSAGSRAASPASTTTIACPSRSSGTPTAIASRASPPAITASSISPGLIRLPADLIISSSRPTKRNNPSAPSTTVSPDHTAMPGDAAKAGAGRNRCAVRSGSRQ